MEEDIDESEDSEHGRALYGHNPLGSLDFRGGGEEKKTTFLDSPATVKEKFMYMVRRALKTTMVGMVMQSRRTKLEKSFTL